MEDEEDGKSLTQRERGDAEGAEKCELAQRLAMIAALLVLFQL
jgi:hypothetical protein